ncbi:hypothetical protein ASE85_17350 [Sphingobium sp. Leaf26]|nr:hypothetical protein ASE85_17350 [Sphingobium sp. Leaf26]
MAIQRSRYGVFDHGQILIFADVAALCHRHICAGALDRDDLFDRAVMGERGVDIGLKRDLFAAAQPFVGGDEEAGIAIATLASGIIGR